MLRVRQAPVLLHVAGRPKPVMGYAEVEDQTPRNPVLLHRVPVFPGSSRLGIEPKTPGCLVQDPTTRLIGDLIPTTGGSGDQGGVVITFDPPPPPPQNTSAMVGNFRPIFFFKIKLWFYSKVITAPPWSGFHHECNTSVELDFFVLRHLSMTLAPRPFCRCRLKPSITVIRPH